MKRLNLNVLGGLLLIVGGLLLLLTNFNIIHIRVAPILWFVFLGAVGAVFTWVFATDREEAWWAAIPGITLLSIAFIVFLDLIMPKVTDVVGGPIVTMGIGLSFLLIYLVKQEFWWALIPGGTMATITVMILLSEFIESGEFIAAFFFLGLAATFGLIYALPSLSGERQTWAIYPALVMLAMAVLMLLIVSASLIWQIWPFILIAIGVYLIYRTFQGRKESR
jgi:hypothetical protein